MAILYAHKIALASCKPRGLRKAFGRTTLRISPTYRGDKDERVVGKSWSGYRTVTQATTGRMTSYSGWSKVNLSGSQNPFVITLSQCLREDITTISTSGISCDPSCARVTQEGNDGDNVVYFSNTMASQCLLDNSSLDGISAFFRSPPCSWISKTECLRFGENSGLTGQYPRVPGSQH